MSKFNRWLLNVISGIHSLIGADINDPRTSSCNFQLNSWINQEDLAGNAIDLLLIFTAKPDHLLLIAILSKLAVLKIYSLRVERIGTSILNLMFKEFIILGNGE